MAGAPTEVHSVLGEKRRAYSHESASSLGWSGPQGKTSAQENADAASDSSSRSKQAVGACCVPEEQRKIVDKPGQWSFSATTRTT